MTIKTSASLLASNLAQLALEISRCKKSGVDWVHFDVMDGVFVDQITYGSPVLKTVRASTDMFLDVHLMVEDPTKQIALFADAGADLITIHVESFCNIGEVLKDIRKRGKKVALAVKPKTPIEAVYPYLHLCDMVLVMTVEPGYGGQAFMPETVSKIASLRKTADTLGMKELDIQVDGGISEKTAEAVKKAGANVLVAGTSLFKSENMKETNDALKNAV
ncbi:MAG: ribulose-phosphate 3-epimerase [Oscillospiraceae bacterium]|nr:ribulose-phosphate 3-epimerase [Oscillospiraceae bacterium]